MRADKEEIILIGGGGHCSSVIDVIELEGNYRIAGIVDTKEKLGQDVFGYGIFACDNDLPELAKQYPNFIITIGQLYSAQRRIEIYNTLIQCKAIMPSIISPVAYVSKHARVGKGSIIMHMAQVNANAVIGDNCIINSKALIEHDAKVGDHCHVSTGAIINGGVVVGNNSFIGSGVVTKQYSIISQESFIKANTLYTGNKK